MHSRSMLCRLCMSVPNHQNWRRAVRSGRGRIPLHRTSLHNNRHSIPPTPKRHEIQPLTPEQARKLLQAAREHKLEALLTVAITTGMRGSELLGQHWQDIDFKARSLHVRRTVNRIGTFGLVESESKTQRSRRMITLPVFVIDMLKQHQEHQKELREKAGGHWREMGIVFCNLYGGYFEPSNLHNAYKKLLKSAGLPDIRFHGVRHSAATILLGMGVHPKIVQVAPC